MKKEHCYKKRLIFKSLNLTSKFLFEDLKSSNFKINLLSGDFKVIKLFILF